MLTQKTIRLLSRLSEIREFDIISTDAQPTMAVTSPLPGRPLSSILCVNL
jgi:hypothetical protein